MLSKRDLDSNVYLHGSYVVLAELISRHVSVMLNPRALAEVVLIEDGNRWKSDSKLDVKHASENYLS